MKKIKYIKNKSDVVNLNFIKLSSSKTEISKDGNFVHLQKYIIFL